MDIRIYTGGHQATTEHFLSALNNNNDILLDEKISCIPADINTFRNIFTASKAIRNGKNEATVGQQLLEQLGVIKDAKKLLLNDYRIIGQEHRAFEKEMFYPRNRGLIKQIQTIFSGSNIRLFIETRSFTSFMPSCYSHMVFTNNAHNFDDFLAETDPENLQWSSLIERSQGRGTKLPATTWRYEDYAYIWRDIVGAITGVKKYQDLIAPPENLDLSINLQTALLFNKYIQQYPTQTPEEFEKLKTVFLAQDLSAIKKLASPGWSAGRIDALAHRYDDDWYYIERMDGVETILPRRIG